jgi:hypothetical protein
MPETDAVDRPPVATGSATVSASALAVHLDCSRAYIGKLEAEGVVQRQDDGFRLDQSRVAYLRYLRRERKQSPRSEADADFIRAKAELIQIRIMQKRGELMRFDDHAARVERMTGLFMTGLSGLAARIGGRDMAMRRAVDQAVFEMRQEITDAANRLGDEEGEPASGDGT